MSIIVSPPAPVVNPTPAVPATDPLHDWTSIDTSVPADAADDFDGYVPGWQDDDQVDAPSERDRFEEAGYQIGLEGKLVLIEETSLGSRAAAESPLGDAFAIGHRRGRTEHARQVGYAWGLEGKALTAGAVHECGWWNDAFAVGHVVGREDRAEREAEMARYFARLDFEHELEERERGFELLAREAGGWDRISGVALI